MNSSASGGGSPPVVGTAAVGAGASAGVAPNIVFDLATAYPPATSPTYRYFRFTNTDVATSGIKIGEMVVGTLTTLSRGLQMPLQRHTDWGVSYVQGKKGPRYLHDRRTTERAWGAKLRVRSSEFTTFRNV